MSTTPDPSQEEDGDEFRINLRRSTTDNLETIYANHFFITFTGAEFYLTFAEAAPPSFFSDKDPSNIPEYVEIKPVVRLAVSPDNMLKIADAIARTVKNSLKRTPSFGEDL